MRRAAIALAILASATVLAALALTSTSRPAVLAADPFTTPARALSAAAPTRLCLAGPGAAVSSLPAAPLPDLARRAFALERLTELAGAAPAFPQRMGLAATAIPEACRK